jgi:hypothetical protein
LSIGLRRIGLRMVWALISFIYFAGEQIFTCDFTNGSKEDGSETYFSEFKAV